MATRRDKGNGLPLWLTIVMDLTLAGLLVFNVVRYGPNGYPTTMVLGGLIGAIHGFDKFLKSQDGE